LLFDFPDMFANFAPPKWSQNPFEIDSKGVFEPSGTKKLAKTLEYCKIKLLPLSLPSSLRSVFKSISRWESSSRRFRVPLYSDFGATFASRTASKKSKKLHHFLNIWCRFWPQFDLQVKSDIFGTCIFEPLLPSLLDKAPRMPQTSQNALKTQIVIACWVGHNVCLISWAPFPWNGVDHFSGNSAMQPVARTISTWFFQNMCAGAVL